jgi:hypothetical protein
MKLTNETARKIKKRVAEAVTTAEIAMFSAPTAFAVNDNVDLNTTMNKLIDIVTNVCSGIGIVIAIWGVVSFATSMTAQNAEQRKHGIMELIAGIIICIAPQILKSIGLSTQL